MRLRTICTMCWGLAILATLPGSAAAQALTQPAGWETRAERFVAMPPGFHITTSPSVLLYHPEARAEGTFRIESEAFLFPGDSPHRYGVFFGARNLDADDAVWTSFEIGLDGRWVVRTREVRDRQRGFEVVDLAGPAPGPVVLPEGENPARNALVVAAGREQVEFRLNGETVAALPRDAIPVDGVTGFRIGSELNLHVLSLTVETESGVERWAPAPADQPEEDGS